MKNKITVFITALFLLYGFFPLYAQFDSRGAEFWLTFGRNWRAASVDAVNLQIRIVGGEHAATGTIYFTALGTSLPFSVGAGQIYTHNLTLAQRQAVYHDNASSTITNRSIRITSTASVAVYALNQHSWSADATNLLPTPILGTEYFHMSYMSNVSTSRDAYAVIAIEDATRVYHNGTLMATLNAGQVYFHRADAFIDMTGTHITSNKPIAFFAMNEGVNIPNGVSASDNLFQQLAPVNTWGTNFFAPVSHRGADRVRIIASQDGTDITQVGGILPVTVPTGSQNRLSNLNAGEWVELEITSNNNGAFISANNPIGVCVYLTGSTYTMPREGDPSQAWLPALEQTVRTALLAPFIPLGNTQLVRHYALVVTPTATKNNTTIRIGTGTEQPLSGGTWHDHSSGWSYYVMRLVVATQSYTFSNMAGLFVLGYGVGNDESYYFLSASAFRTLDAAFYANDIHNQDLVVTPSNTSQINFRAEMQGDISTQPGHIRWFVNGVEQVSAIDQLTWSTNLPNGTYEIVMRILLDDNFTTREIEGTLIVAIPTIRVNPHVKKRIIED